jgi:hypothetical protein
MQKLRITLFFIFSLFAFGVSKAQTNLVINPSFETYTACPNGLAEIYKAASWDIYNGSPDYFNPCASNPTAQVPSNGFGYQMPINGNSYAGLITYGNSGLIREIMGVPLTTQLSVSQKYFVSFMTVRGNTDNFNVGYSSNKIGVKFTKTSTVYTMSISNSAHYYSNVIITDTLNWVRVAGSFVADSAYKNIMIGNFFDDSNTTITNQSSGTFAYYFIDDVCVSTDSIFAYNYSTSVQEKQKTEKVRVNPNPANEQIIIETLFNSKLTVYNSSGEEVNFSYKAIDKGYSIKVSDWEDGLYLIKMNNTIRKIIINH